MKTKKTKLHYILVSLTLAATLLPVGCVRRRMVVRSNPPGATVYLDGKEIGRTPLSTNFEHYGKREFRLVKQGYETKTTILPVRAPWYQWFGLDFVSEVLLPGKLTDRHDFEFDLYPEQIVPKYELVERAEDLRRAAHSEGAVRITEGAAATMTPQTPAGSIVPYNPEQSTPPQPYNPAPVAPQPAPQIYPQPTLAPQSDPNGYAPPRF